MKFPYRSGWCWALLPLICFVASFAVTVETHAQSTCTIPYTFVNGTIADGTQVNADFTAAINCINASGGVGLPRTGNNASLKALAAGAYPYVYREGYYALSDGGGAAYYWSALAACTDDGGSCIAPNVGSGRWLIIPQPVYDIRIFGAKCDASTNDSPAIQADLTFNAGKVLIPAATCKITATLSVTKDATNIDGFGRSSVLLCATGATDCIDVIGVSTANQIYGDFIRNIRILGSGLSGGNAISYRFAAQGGVEGVVLDTIWNGFAFSGVNDIRVRDGYVTSPGGAGQYGIKWYSAAGTERSDVLTLDHVTLNVSGGGADCMIWNDNTNTLRVFGVNMLGCAKGLRINTAGVTTNFPQFLQADDLEADTASSYALITESYASSLSIINSQLTTAGGVPAINISANSDRIYIANTRAQGSYGVQIENGATHVLLVGNDYNSSSTGSVNDLSNGASQIGGISSSGNEIGVKIGGNPTVTSCGTSPPATVGSNSSGTISTGSGTVNACTVHFSANWPQTPFCIVTSSNTGFTTAVTSVDAAGFTAGFSTSIPSTSFYYHCNSW